MKLWWASGLLRLIAGVRGGDSSKIEVTCKKSPEGPTGTLKMDGPLERSGAVLQSNLSVALHCS